MKRPTLVLAPIATSVALVSWVIVPWVTAIDLRDRPFSLICGFNACLWMIITWWALHHLTYQLAAVTLPSPVRYKIGADAAPRIVILYPTLNDFQQHCCQSCVTQDYPGDRFRVIICDDSDDARIRQEIDAFASTSPRISVVRRPLREGFKAGNLNHAIERATTVGDQWLVIVDSDEILPRSYLLDLAGQAASQVDAVAFIQCAHESDAQLWRSYEGTEKPVAPPTPFQSVLGLEIDVFYQRDIVCRERFGFLPMLGHGAALYRPALLKIGGIPTVVSEDYALSMRFAAAGFRGVYAEHIGAWEAFPKDFGSFVRRMEKFAGGSAELLRYECGNFLRSDATTTEKLDLMMQLLWYPLMPIVVVNEVLSAYVCSELWRLRLSVLHPVMPYFFVGMFLCSVAALVSRKARGQQIFRYWFWAQAVYGACLPLASVRFVRHLFVRPSFQRTPKGREEQPGYRVVSALLVVLGILEVSLSAYWWSPFSLVLASRGVAYLGFPVYRKLACPGVLGALSRILVFIPGMLALGALYSMWKWGKFLGVGH